MTKIDSKQNDNNSLADSLIWVIVIINFILFIIGWLLGQTNRQREQSEPSAALSFNKTPLESDIKSTSQSQKIPNPTHNKKSLHPAPVIRNLYLEITNIMQGVNLAILVAVITRPAFTNSIIVNSFSPLLFAATSLMIIVIFWARYYLDTEILNRSLRTFSILWFFGYLLFQGISISFIGNPIYWLASTGVFLSFGVGFYLLNLSEIRRKQKAGVFPEWSDYVRWQSKRLIDLIYLTILCITGIYLITRNEVHLMPVAIVIFFFALWQLFLTGDYRKHGFINTGI